MNLLRLMIVIGFPSITIWGWLNALHLLNLMNPWLGFGFGLFYPSAYVALYRGMIRELGWKRYFAEIFNRKSE